MSHATIKDIAKYLSVSIATVSRALSNEKNIRPETREKVLSAAKALGYKANPVGRNLQSRKTNTVGVIIPELVTPFYQRIIEGIQNVLYEKQMKVIIAQSGEDPETEKGNLLLMDDFMVDGIIIGVCHKDKNKDEYLRLIQNGMPLVFCDRVPIGMDVTKVIVDDYIKAFFLVEALIRNGRRRIAHIKGPSYLSSSYERFRGYKDALDKFNVPYDQSLIVETKGMDFNSGEDSISRLINTTSHFDAVFAFTDTVAIGAMNYLRRHDYPGFNNIAIAGFSGTEISEIVSPALTTVEQPRYEMGKACAELILEQIKNPLMQPRTLVLDAEIKIRESIRSNG